MNPMERGFAFVKNHKVLLLSFVLVIGFVTLAVYLYYTQVLPSMKKKNYKENTELVRRDEDSGDRGAIIPELYYFYVDWCPHCRKATPEINRIEENHSDIVHVVKVDCETDEGKTLANNNGVEGFPTIKMMVDGKVYDYDAKVNYENLLQFIHAF